MAIGVSEILLLISGDDRGAVRALDNVSRRMGVMQGVGGMVTSALLTAAAAATGLAVVGGGAAIDLATKFQQQMTLIRTQAGDTVDNLTTLGQQFVTMAGQYGQAPIALAQAYYHLASVGYVGAQGLDILTRSAQLAAVGQADLTDTTNAVIGILKNYPKGTYTAAQAVGQLNAIVGAGNVTLSQFVTSMSSGVQGAAAAYGVSLTSLGAAYDFLTDRNVKASEASTRLRMSIALLGAPTAKSASIMNQLGLGVTVTQKQTNAMWTALGKLGVSQTALAADMRKPDGIMVALQDLHTHMVNAGLTPSEQAAVITRSFGGARSGAAIQQMALDLTSTFNDTSQDSLQAKYDAIVKHAQDFPTAWQTQQKTFNQQLNNLKGSVQGAGVTIGTVLMPYAEQFVHWLSVEVPPVAKAFTDWLTKNKGTISEVAGVIKTGLIGAFQALGSALVVAGGFFAKYIWPPLKTLGGFAYDLRGPLADLALALAGLFVIKKIGSGPVGWATDAIKALGKVKNYITGALGPALVSLTTGHPFTALRQLIAGPGSAAKNLPGEIEGVTGQRVFVTNWEMIRGGGGGGGGLPGKPAGKVWKPGGAGGGGKWVDAAAGTETAAAPEEAEVLGAGLGAGGALGTAVAIAAPLGMLAQNIQSVSGWTGALAAAPWQKIIGAMQHMGVSSADAAANAAEVKKAWDNGKIHSSQEFTAMTKHLANISLVTEALNGMVGKTAPQIGDGFILLESKLNNMGLSWQKSVEASDSLQAYVTKYGPLTSSQMEIFYTDVKDGVTDAFGIDLSLSTANQNLQGLPQSASGIASAMSSLKKSIPGALSNLLLGNIRGSGGAGGPSTGVDTIDKYINGVLNPNYPGYVAPKKPKHSAIGNWLSPGDASWVGEGGKGELAVAGKAGLAIINQAQLKAAFGDGQGGGNGGSPTVVHVYHPTANVDVTQALSDSRWLDRAAVRNINPGHKWGMIGARDQ